MFYADRPEWEQANKSQGMWFWAFYSLLISSVVINAIIVGAEAPPYWFILTAVLFVWSVFCGVKSRQCDKIMEGLRKEWLDEMDARDKERRERMAKRRAAMAEYFEGKF